MGGRTELGADTADFRNPKAPTGSPMDPGTQDWIPALWRGFRVVPPVKTHSTSKKTDSSENFIKIDKQIAEKKIIEDRSMKYVEML